MDRSSFAVVVVVVIAAVVVVIAAAVVVVVVVVVYLLKNVRNLLLLPHPRALEKKWIQKDHCPPSRRFGSER